MATVEIRNKVWLDESKWLTRYIQPEHISSIKVSRINLDLLEEPSLAIIKDWFEIDPSLYHHVMFLLDKDGNKLAEVGRIEPKPDPEFRFWKPWKWLSRLSRQRDETPSDTLVRLGPEADKVHFIVSFGWNKSRSLKKPRDVTIFKYPKGFTLHDWKGHLQQCAEDAWKRQQAAVAQDARRQITEAETP